MVDAAEGTSRRSRDWSLEAESVATPTPARRGWDDAIHTRSFMPLDLSAFAAAGLTRSSSPLAAVTGSNQTFADTTSLGPEILRLKSAVNAPGHDDATRAAVRQQIVMRQAEWVTKALAEGRRAPDRPLDPLRASAGDVANALAWSELGGVVPRDELARDGGRAFHESIRDAVVVQTKGFDALVAAHANDPSRQRALLTSELSLHGVHADAAANLDALRARLDEVRRNEDARAPAMGLDGHVAPAATLDRYERSEAIAAMNPGTTLGSILATSSVVESGKIDVPRMRADGAKGNALEAFMGGAGLAIENAKNTREPFGTVKPDLDNFNRTGLPPRFRTTPMNPAFRGEDQPGNDVWNLHRPGKPFQVTYATRPIDRAPFRLEVQDARLVDANGAPFDTRGATAHDGKPCAIFVMNAQGEVFASTFQEAGTLHHSSLAGGEPVAAAGELVVHDGRVVVITNRSGHYRPSPELNDQVIDALRQQGLDLHGVRVVTQSPIDPFAHDERVLP